MRVIPPTAPPQRLLSSLEPDRVDAKASPEEESPFAVRGSRIFSGNGRAIFIGISAGALLLCVVGYLFKQRERGRGAQPTHLTEFVPALTHTVSASAHEVVTPAPIVIQIDSKLIHVTAISLGHPRLAVINGQTVSEGDYVKVRSVNPTVMVSLRVIRIGDGRIELSDGAQTITTRLTLSGSE
jgi:hypothetical protein